MAEPICGAPAPYGGTGAARKHSRSDLGWMGHCNQRVKAEGLRCWRHPNPITAVTLND
jgi:hypothetical protein